MSNAKCSPLLLQIYVLIGNNVLLLQTRKQKDEWFDNQKNKVDKLYEDLSQLYTKQANLGSVLLYSSAMYEVERQINETMDKIWEAEGELAERDSHAVYDLAAVHVYFKELGIVKYNRDELYRAIDVIGKKCNKNCLQALLLLFLSLVRRHHRAVHGFQLAQWGGNCLLVLHQDVERQEGDKEQMIVVCDKYFFS